MGKYQVSEKNYKSYVHTVIRERLQEDVIWGMNAENPMDALTFSEDYITCDATDDAIKRMICDYLFKSGFHRITSGGTEKSTTVYIFPQKPSGRFEEIYNEYVEAQKKAMQDLKKEAIAEVRAEISNDEMMTMIFKTYNAYTHACIDEELAKFPYILRYPTAYRDWMYAHKKPTEKTPYNIETLVRESDKSYEQMLSNAKSRFLLDVSWLIKKIKWQNKAMQITSSDYTEQSIPTLYVTYVSPRIYKDFVKQLSKDGYEVSHFPMHSKGAYVYPAYKGREDIPVYISIPKKLMEKLKMGKS